MAAHRPQACWEAPYPFYAENPAREAAPPGGCLISGSYGYRIPECAKEDDPREFQAAWRPPPPPPAFPLHVQRPDWREEFHWRAARGYLPVGGAFYHQGQMPGQGGAYEALHDDHHHALRTEPVLLDADAARRWAKPRRRVRSIDQGDDYRQFRMQPRHYIEVYKATHRDPYLFASEEDVVGRGDLPVAGQRRLAGPIRDLVAARQSMLSDKYEAVDEGGGCGRRSDVGRPQSEQRRGSPREVEVQKGRAAQKARSNGGRERTASPEDSQEMNRLQQIADDYAKMKEENEKLQEDLNKSKRLNKNLRKENRRLFRKQNSAAAEQQKQEAEAVPVPPPLTPSEGDDVLQQHVIQQLQSLQMEKAKLLQENCQLTRDNESLQELLHYAVGEPGSGSEGGSSSECDSEDESQDDCSSHSKGLKEHMADHTGAPPLLCEQSSGIPA